ncbi:hypothetical protein [Peptoniphilus sp.]|jgi:hypothetical protein|uniref:hypothetical protein n=1 Tax=Peptoniphilus sp. TaxID=1971214 RepID=UPI003D8F2108
MNEKYLSFLISELIFTIDDLEINQKQEITSKYDETFGELESIAEELNLNIRILRRKIELINTHTPQDVEEIIKKEFKEEEKSEEVQEINTKVDKKELDDIYREIINRVSPVLYDFSHEDFDKIKEHYKNKDLESLRKIKKELPKLSLKLSEEELEETREDLEYKIAFILKEFPFNQMELLENHDAVVYNLQKLEQLCEDYKMMYASLQEEYNLKAARFSY